MIFNNNNEAYKKIFEAVGLDLHSTLKEWELEGSFVNAVTPDHFDTVNADAENEDDNTGNLNPLEWLDGDTLDAIADAGDTDGELNSKTHFYVISPDGSLIVNNLANDSMALLKKGVGFALSNDKIILTNGKVTFEIKDNEVYTNAVICAKDFKVIK